MNAPLDKQQALQPDSISLDDKYTLERGRVFLTGTQALVRLPMMQRQRDLVAGLNTAGCARCFETEGKAWLRTH